MRLVLARDVRMVSISRGAGSSDRSLRHRSHRQQASQRFKRLAHHDRECRNGNILARPDNIGLADRDDPVVIIGDIKTLAIHDFVFEENHRVGVTDRRFQQPFGICRRPRRNNLQPGQWAYQLAKHCECCAATRAAAPFGPRKTMGQPI